MIGSFWLHAFGQLAGEDDKLVPFGALNEPNVRAIGRSGVGRMVIYDQDPVRVELALKELNASKFPFEVSKRLTLHAISEPSRSLEVAILERKEVEYSGGSAALNLRGVQCGRHEKVRWMGDKLELSLSSNKWWNVAKLPLTPMKDGYRISIRCRIEVGFVRFSLQDESSRIHEHVEKWPSTDIQEIVLTAPQNLDHPCLCIRSLYPNRSSSKIVIESIEIKKQKP
jgi:hypothetical protein